MTDKSLILTLPAELLDRANAANLDLRQLLLETLEEKLPHFESDILEILKARLPAENVEAALNALQQGQRILGLHAGTFWMSDDFDAELPNEFWLGEDA